jgi:hypothetical protein
MTKTNPSYAKLTATLIGAWFILSLVASALHVFSTDPSRPPTPLGVAALAPIACSYGGLQPRMHFANSFWPWTRVH